MTVIDREELPEHARREMELLEAEAWLIDGVVEMVQAYSKMGHDVKQIVLPLLDQLIDGNILTPLTDDPDEWERVTEGEDHWQNVRDSSAFSENGGKTYFLLSESLDTPELKTRWHESKKSGKNGTNLTIDEAAIEQVKEENPNISTPEAVEKVQEEQ